MKPIFAVTKRKQTRPEVNLQLLGEALKIANGTSFMQPRAEHLRVLIDFARAMNTVRNVREREEVETNG